MVYVRNETYVVHLRGDIDVFYWELLMSEKWS